MFVLAAAACARAPIEPDPIPPQDTRSTLDEPTASNDSPAEATPPEHRGPRPPATIYRSEVERALARGPGHLLYQLGPEPYRLSGRFVGWQITRVFPDDPQLCSDGCDLLPGDIILSVNGDRLETPQAFSNLVEALPNVDTLVVKSIRDERRRAVTYAIVD